MFATPNTAGRSGATRRLPFSTSGTASRRRSNLFDDEEPGAESPVPPTHFSGVSNNKLQPCKPNPRSRVLTPIILVLSSPSCKKPA